MFFSNYFKKAIIEVRNRKTSHFSRSIKNMGKIGFPFLNDLIFVTKEVLSRYQILSFLYPMRVLKMLNFSPRSTVWRSSFSTNRYLVAWCLNISNAFG